MLSQQKISFYQNCLCILITIVTLYCFYKNSYFIHSKTKDIFAKSKENSPNIQVNQTKVTKLKLQSNFSVCLYRKEELQETIAIDIVTPKSVEDPRFDKVKKRKKLLKCKDVPLIFEREQHGNYWVLKNLIRGKRSSSIGCAESLTFTTNGDYTFFDNLPELVKRWKAPISFAIFAPGSDFFTTVESIQYLRNCVPEAELIQNYVTFHLFFPNNHMPEILSLNEQVVLTYPYNCSADYAPYENVDRADLYKTKANLTYPINVARNIARKAANTYFIFACDIELYPSYNLPEKFLDLVDRQSSRILFSGKQRVFPMPVFEIDVNQTIPANKFELKRMLREKTAVSFHERVCKFCHLVPKQTQWLTLEDTETFSLFKKAKRRHRYKSWEPFYISDNKEPLFDERVTWEGQSNKRIQNFAMCLLDYEYYLLNPPFLVHRPGIKVFKKTDRLKYVAEMNKLIQTQIVPEYRILFGQNKNCAI